VKFTIRKGVFETNSSSVHALVINKGSGWEIPITSTAEKIKVYTGDFGWESETYQASEDKLSYILTGIVIMDDREFGTILKETFPEYDFPQLNKIKNGSYVQIDDVEAMIDHGAPDFSLFKEHPAILRAFVMDSDNFIVTGNDNGAMPYETDDEGNITSFPNAEYVIEKGN